MLAPLPRRCDRDDQVLATATAGSRSRAPDLAPSLVLWGSACGAAPRRAMKMVSSTRAACLAASTSRRSATSLRLRLSRPCSRSFALVEAAPGGGIVPGEYRSSKRSNGVSDLRSANAEDGAAVAATEAWIPALALRPLRLDVPLPAVGACACHPRATSTGGGCCCRGWRGAHSSERRVVRRTPVHHTSR